VHSCCCELGSRLHNPMGKRREGVGGVRRVGKWRHGGLHAWVPSSLTHECRHRARWVAISRSARWGQRVRGRGGGGALLRTWLAWDFLPGGAGSSSRLDGIGMQSELLILCPCLIDRDRLEKDSQAPRRWSRARAAHHEAEDVSRLCLGLAKVLARRVRPPFSSSLCCSVSQWPRRRATPQQTRT
jgi:hypothetical protein